MLMACEANSVYFIFFSTFYISYSLFPLEKMGSLWERFGVAGFPWYTPNADQWSDFSNKACHMWWYWWEILRCRWCCSYSCTNAFKASSSWCVSFPFLNSFCHLLELYLALFFFFFFLNGKNIVGFKLASEKIFSMYLKVENRNMLHE